MGITMLSCNRCAPSVILEVRNTEGNFYETLGSFFEEELPQLLPPFRVSQPGEGFTARVGAFLSGIGGKRTRHNFANVAGLKADCGRQQTLTTHPN